MESLRKLGMSALLAYGFVSNVSGVIAVSSAWFIFSKKVSCFYISISKYRIFGAFIMYHFQHASFLFLFCNVILDTYIIYMIHDT